MNAHTLTDESSIETAAAPQAESGTRLKAEVPAGWLIIRVGSEAIDAVEVLAGEDTAEVMYQLVGFCHGVANCLSYISPSCRDSLASAMYSWPDRKV